MFPQQPRHDEGKVKQPVCNVHVCVDWISCFSIRRLTLCMMCPADYQSDSDSFNPALWEEQRQQRMTVAFDFEDKKEEEDNSSKVKVPPASFVC